MLDFVCIFTYGGVALWSHKPPLSLLTGDTEPIDALISNVLIEVHELGKGYHGRERCPACGLRLLLLEAGVR